MKLAITDRKKKDKYRHERLFARDFVFPKQSHAMWVSSFGLKDLSIYFCLVNLTLLWHAKTIFKFLPSI